jgi:sphingomyelin phosphodiesterase
VDPRFDIGSEANCTSGGLCCRFDASNIALGTDASNPSIPASRYGDYLCDSPPDLALSAFADMRKNVDLAKVGFSIFTGDIVSHDQTDQESRALVEYEERVAYETFKAQLGNVPVYATLGNHDSWPSGFNTPNNFRNDSVANSFSWNYELISSLWQQEGWLNGSETGYAAKHYGAYAHTTKEGLRIISINTDFWYTPNIFNYYNFTNPDKSGILRFLADELLAAEAKDQRVWIIGHVPSGGSSAVGNPSVLFHSIVARFSPATIAGIFFGHTHQDGKQILYDFAGSAGSNSSVVRNYTDLNYEAPLSVAYIGPSIVPLTNYNAGWSVYQVDRTTFSVVNGQVHFANISNSLSWDQSPVWEFEYDIRSTYDPDAAWSSTAPLNATFWDGVTRDMMSNSSIIERYLFLATKQSVKTPSCDGTCLVSSICDIRSSNAAVYERCHV